MRKIVCAVLVWLLVCLPAMAASTTDSQIMMMLDDDSGIGIMPLSVISDYSASVASGWNKLSTDSHSVGSYVSYGSGNRFGVNSFTWSESMMYQIRFKFSGLSISAGNNVVVDMSRIRLMFNVNKNDGNLYQLSLCSSSVPYNSYVVMQMSGTKQVGSSWNSVSAQVVNNVSVNLSDWFLNSYNNSYNLGSSLNSTFPIPLPDGWSSGSVTEFILVINYVVNSTNFLPNTTTAFYPVAGDSVTTIAGWQSSSLYVNTNNWGGSSSSGSGSSGALTALSRNLTVQMNQVKTTIQQGASEVKDSINNQTQTLTNKLTSVKDDILGGIIDLKDSVTKGFSDVVTGITELPGKIGEMLQGLIVPDSETVSGKFSDFNDLAEEKLGVIYQVPEMVISMGQSIVSGTVEQKGEMTLPKFEIIMPATNQSRAGETLTVWEEYTFPIWPDGTEVIHTAVQTVTSMICVIAMINSLKRKYEDWLDGK